MLNVDFSASLHLSHTHKLQRSEDGLVRIDFDVLCCLPFEHIVSGLNCSLVDPQAQHPILKGYTEWVYENGSPITLGWDWQWVWKNQAMQLESIGPVRSNIQLLQDGYDVSPRHNQILLQQAIQQYLDWHQITMEQIQQRHSINS